MQNIPYHGTSCLATETYMAWVQSPVSPDHLCQVYNGVCFEIKLSGSTEGLTIFSLSYHCWLIRGSETLSISRHLNR